MKEATELVCHALDARVLRKEPAHCVRVGKLEALANMPEHQVGIRELIADEVLAARA